MKCPRCGKDNPSGVKVCLICGTPLPPPMPKRAASPGHHHHHSSAGGCGHDHRHVSSTPKKAGLSKSDKTIIGILAGVGALVLIGIIIAIFAFSGGGRGKGRGAFVTSGSGGGDGITHETTILNIDVIWLDASGKDITSEVTVVPTFSNGYKLGENHVPVKQIASFTEDPVKDFYISTISINDEDVAEVSFVPEAGTEYNILFVNSELDKNRRPNDNPLDTGKLYQLISDGYIDAMLYDDATIRSIDGNFTTIEVNSTADAVRVFNQVSPLLGLTSQSENFNVDDITYSSSGENEEKRNYYRLNPTIGKVPVWGSDIILVVDDTGIPDGLHSSYNAEIKSVNTTPTISPGDAEKSALESFEKYVLNNISYDEDKVSEADITAYIDAVVDAMDIESTLIMCSLDKETPALVWRVDIYNAIINSVEESELFDVESLTDAGYMIPNIDYSFYVYANGANAGQIKKQLNNTQNDWIPSTTTAEDKNGNNRTINIEVDGNRERLVDTTRNIKTYETLYGERGGGILGIGAENYTVIPGRIITKGVFGWNKKGVSAHYNMGKAYDFYNSLGRKSYDGKGKEIITSIGYVDYEGKSDIKWLLYATLDDNAQWSPSNAQFMFFNSGNNESALDTVGHEYTHAVINTTVCGSSLVGTIKYEGESGALNEAYADIMGSLVEGKGRNNSGRWLHGEDSGKASRNFADPESMGCADNYSDLTDPWWDNYLDRIGGDYGGVHVFNGVVTLAYYYMVMDNNTSCTNAAHNHSLRTSNITDDKWTKVFYNSIHHLQVDAKFIDARAAIINEARALGFTETQIKAIEEAFEDVGIVGNDVYLAKDTFDWEWYEHKDYEFKHMNPQPEDRPHSISVTGKDIIMDGFNVEAYKDFMFMPDNNENTKIFSFELVRDKTDWHSIEGGGFLFNTKIEDGTIEGYCILTTKSGLKLVRIDKCDLTDFRNGKYNYVENTGRLLTTVNIGDPYAKQSYVIEVDNETVSVWCNNELYIDSFELPTESTGYGFGPITSHANHACEQLSYYTFSNIRMESLRPNEGKSE